MHKAANVSEEKHLIKLKKLSITVIAQNAKQKKKKKSFKQTK